MDRSMGRGDTRVGDPTLASGFSSAEFTGDDGFEDFLADGCADSDAAVTFSGHPFKVVSRYGIRSKNLLHRPIKVYNCHGEITQKHGGRPWQGKVYAEGIVFRQSKNIRSREEAYRKSQQRFK